MNPLRAQFGKKISPGARKLKVAMLACFHDSADEVARRFLSHPDTEWHELLLWLDISGMALYLLDQVKTLEIQYSLPTSIQQALQTRLERNQQRTAGLLRQAGRVAAKFHESSLNFALLKGITLAPDCAADPALRPQTDLDFLIAESDAAAASQILNNLQYTLRATNGQTLEFRSGATDKPDLTNMYRVNTQQCLELHLLHRPDGSPDLLARTRIRLFGDVAIPALSPADMIVQQALHILKHLCGEHTRLSWQLEFWRHMRLRQNDAAFWDQVKEIAATEPQGDLALAMSIWLAADLFGPIEHGAVEHWTADRIPGGIQHWLQRYGRRVLLSESFGSKLYLLLRRQLPVKPDTKTTARLVIPLNWPARITQPSPSETLAQRLARYRVELDYTGFRLRFHLLEGIRYVIEMCMWQRWTTKADQL